MADSDKAPSGYIPPAPSVRVKSKRSTMYKWFETGFSSLGLRKKHETMPPDQYLEQLYAAAQTPGAGDPTRELQTAAAPPAGGPADRGTAVTAPPGAIATAASDEPPRTEDGAAADGEPASPTSPSSQRSWFVFPWNQPLTADDVDSFGKRKSRFQVLSRNNARSALASMQGILTRRVYVSAERAEVLLKLREDLAAGGGAAAEQGGGAAAGTGKGETEGRADSKGDGTGEGKEGRIPMLLIDFTDEQVAYLKDALAGEFDLRAVTLLPRDWTSLLKTSREKFIVPDRDLDAAALEAMEREESAHGGAAVVTGAPPRVVAIRVAALDAATGRLPDFQARALAVHFMASRVVVPFVDCGADEQERAHAAVEDLLCGTWVAHSSLEGVAKFCLGGGRSPSGASLREVLRLRQAVRDEVFGKIEKWGRVNYVWHGLKRMPVAFVPFGVSAVNFIGLSRLVAKILLATGMARDRATKATGVTLAGQAYAKVFVLDNIGDMYQFVAGGTVVYSLTSAVAMGEGLAEAVNALAVSDVALLGSASVVTGAVAALGAALTRPHMVAMLADLIATLQTIWLLFPAARRAASDDGAAADAERAAVPPHEDTAALAPALFATGALDGSGSNSVVTSDDMRAVVRQMGGDELLGEALPDFGEVVFECSHEGDSGGGGAPGSPQGALAAAAAAAAASNRGQSRASTAAAVSNPFAFGQPPSGKAPSGYLPPGPDGWRRPGGGAAVVGAASGESLPSHLSGMTSVSPRVSTDYPTGDTDELPARGGGGVAGGGDTRVRAALARLNVGGAQAAPADMAGVYGGLEFVRPQASSGGGGAAAASDGTSDAFFLPMQDSVSVRLEDSLRTSSVAAVAAESPPAAAAAAPAAVAAAQPAPGAVAVSTMHWDASSTFALETDALG